MTSYAIIPKVLLARNSIEYVQKIPKIIWQTMKTNRVPPFMKSYADTWIDLNPEYEYRFYDDNDITDFIKTEFPGYLDGYNKIKYGASRSDLWRYLIMYKYGGVYADMDCRCINPLRQWMDPEAAYVTQLGTNKDICQWLIISVPQNPVFIKAAQKTLQNSERNNSSTAHYGFEFIENKLVIRENEPLRKFNHAVFGLSGPPVLQEAAEACFREGTISGILQFSQIVCVSEAVSCQMSGHVSHDSGHPEYKKALRKLKSSHYNRLFERVRRKFINIFSAGKSSN